MSEERNEKEPGKIVKAILKASSEGKVRRGVALFLMLSTFGGVLAGCGDSNDAEVTTSGGGATTTAPTTTVTTNQNNQQITPVKPVSSELERIIQDVCGFEDFDYDFLTSSYGDIMQLHLAGTALVDGVKKETVLSYNLDEETYKMLKEVELDVNFADGFNFVDSYHFYEDDAVEEIKNSVIDIANRAPDQISYYTNEEILSNTLDKIFEMENGFVLANVRSKDKITNTRIYFDIDGYICLNEKDQNGKTKYLFVTWEFYQVTDKFEKDENGNWIINLKGSIPRTREIINASEIYLSDEEMLHRLTKMQNNLGWMKWTVLHDVKNYSDYINYNLIESGGDHRVK